MNVGKYVYIYNLGVKSSIYSAFVWFKIENTL